MMITTSDKKAAVVASPMSFAELILCLHSRVVMNNPDWAKREKNPSFCESWVNAMQTSPSYHHYCIFKKFHSLSLSRNPDKIRVKKDPAELFRLAAASKQSTSSSLSLLAGVMVVEGKWLVLDGVTLLLIKFVAMIYDQKPLFISFHPAVFSLSLSLQSNKPASFYVTTLLDLDGWMKMRKVCTLCSFFIFLKFY